MIDRWAEVGGEYAHDDSMWGSNGEGTAVVSAQVARGSTLRWVGSGREALRLLAYALFASGRRVLALPAWVCPSMRGAFDASWDVRYLPIGPDLAPEPDAIAAFGQAFAASGVVLAAPPFGPLYRTEVRVALRHAERLGVPVIEDRTHSLLTRGAVPARWGVASLRKWGPLADGAAAWGPSLPAVGPVATDGFVVLRRRAAADKARWLLGARIDRSRFLGGFSAAEERLDRREGITGMSRPSVALWRGFEVAAAARRRRANHRAFHAALDGRAISSLQPALGPGVVPFGIPVLCKDRLGARRAASAASIWCPIHWLQPEDLPLGGHAVTARLQQQILTIPCDQRWSASDMRRVARVLSEVEA